MLLQYVTFGDITGKWHDDKMSLHLINYIMLNFVINYIMLNFVHESAE